jgi:20S proteasome subunit beta 4
MSDSILGICGKDFVLIAADASAGFSIIVMKHDEDKIMKLDEQKLLAACGENGDRVQFCEFIQVR